MTFVEGIAGLIGGTWGSELAGVVALAIAALGLGEVSPGQVGHAQALALSCS